MAAQFELGLAVRNALAVAGILAASYALNDYFDYVLKGEKNFTANLIESRQLSLRRIGLLCWLPLVLCLGMPFHRIIPAGLIIVLLFLTIFYSLPPIRLKERSIWGFIIPPICAVIIFLQAYSLFNGFNLTISMLAIIIFLFHLFVEGIHQMADFFAEENEKIQEKEKIIKLLYLFPCLSLIISLAFAFYQPLFLITVLFSMVRLFTLRKINIEENIFRIRKNIFSPLWSIYEFAIYGALGLTGLLNG